VVDMGAAKNWFDSGVLDGQVKISETAGPHALYDFFLMAVGGRRIMWTAGKARQANFTYLGTLAKLVL
jgi:hypothetical protein